MDFSILHNPQIQILIIISLVGLIVYLIVKVFKLKKHNKNMNEKYRAKPLEEFISDFSDKTTSTQILYKRGQELFEELERRTVAADKELTGINYGIIPPTFSFDDCEDLKNKIKNSHEKQLQAIIDDRAVESISEWSVYGSRKKGDLLIKAYRNLMLKAFNNEFDTIRKAMRYSTYNTASKKLDRLYERITKLGEVARVEITFHYLRLKEGELTLWHEELVRKQKLREELKKQKAILREQAKLNTVDIEDVEEEIDYKEEQLKRAQELAVKILGSETTIKSKVVIKLEAEIAALKAKQERAVSQAQLTKVGYIYVISNIGCFGEDVVKIGMTRRLEPMDRVVELGDASVPFRFDVHTIAFVENAPSIEKILHKKFDEFRVNKENTRKEFFRISPYRVAKEMQRMNIESDWYFEVEAKEYNESLLIRDAEKARKAQAAIYLDGLPESI